MVSKTPASEPGSSHIAELSMACELSMLIIAEPVGLRPAVHRGCFSAGVHLAMWRPWATSQQESGLQGRRELTVLHFPTKCAGTWPWPLRYYRKVRSSAEYADHLAQMPHVPF